MQRGSNTGGFFSVGLHVQDNGTLRVPLQFDNPERPKLEEGSMDPE